MASTLPMVLVCGAETQPVMVNVRVAKGAEDSEDRNTTTTATTNTTNTTTNNRGSTAVAASSLVESSAITYIMSPHLVQKFVHPSPQYLTAVYRTLTSSFPEFSDRAIEICDHTGKERKGEGVHVCGGI